MLDFKVQHDQQSDVVVSTKRMNSNQSYVSATSTQDKNHRRGI